MPSAPDFSLVERTLERRLREFNLSPRAIPRGVETGYADLRLVRTESEAAEADLEDPPRKLFIASIEITATLNHPAAGAAEIRERITFQDDSLNGAIEQCAETYLKVSFPAFQGLFEGEPAPGTHKIKLSSYSEQAGKAFRWEVFSGHLQILNDAGGQLAARLKQQPPIQLCLDTLCGYLSEPRLHWCKPYGAVQPRSGLVFGCAIDGQKSQEAEAEMQRKFRAEGELPGQWEFRQFFLMFPAGEADEATTKLLRDQFQESAEPKQPKRWWNRLFGG